MITKTTRNSERRQRVDRWQSSTNFITDQWELGTPSQNVGPDYCRLSAFKPLTLSVYNVRTLHQHGKLHQLLMGCNDAGIDIA